MDMIIEWITQIIIFLFLAAIIDLLIPATAMKKYIKLVIGLILILIFLKPVFYIFNIDIKHAVETSFTDFYEEEKSAHSIENLIEMQKVEIQASQDAYIEEQMTSQLIDLVKTPLLEQYQAEISDIDFVFSAEEVTTYESLDEVIVYLRESVHGEGAVSIVDDVVISTNDPVDDEEKDSQQIKKLLQEKWELGNKELTIKWGGGTS